MRDLARLGQLAVEARDERQADHASVDRPG
jgi:hypothetical protein